MHSEDNVDNSKKPNGARKDVVVPPTPSKVLFSPVLRTDPATGLQTSHMQHNLHETEDEDEEDNDENQLAAENAPSTPVVGAATLEPEETAEEEEDCDEFNPYQFIAHLPAHASVCIVDKICLPALPGKKQDVITLALDLDETLVHCTVEPIPKPDLVFPVK
jgi:hypothetical protein